MKWMFKVPINLLVIKPRGKHYVVETGDGQLIEKDEDIVVRYPVKTVKDLKKLRSSIYKGKYLELMNAPITDQLWAITGLNTGFIRIAEEEDET